MVAPVLVIISKDRDDICSSNAIAEKGFTHLFNAFFQCVCDLLIATENQNYAQIGHHFYCGIKLKQNDDQIKLGEPLRKLQRTNLNRPITPAAIFLNRCAAATIFRFNF